MARSELLSADAHWRRKIIRHVEDGKEYIESRQDVQALVDYAAACRETVPDKDFTRVAIIPKSELDRAFNEGWYHDPEAWRRWANDPDNRLYRTTEGTI